MEDTGWSDSDDGGVYKGDLGSYFICAGVLGIGSSSIRQEEGDGGWVLGIGSSSIRQGGDVGGRGSGIGSSSIRQGGDVGDWVSGLT